LTTPGARAAPFGAAQNPTAQSTRRPHRFKGTEQGTRSALPWFEATEMKPSPAPSFPFLTVTLRPERGAGIGFAKTRGPGEGARVRRVMRPNHSANNPLFKDREPELHAVFRPGLSRGTGERRASWRGARFRSSGFARCVGLFDRRSR
jgi:hypothetical protein